MPFFPVSISTEEINMELLVNVDNYRLEWLLIDW